MRKNNNKGFSLVELIIVIAIMAVLIGVLAPQFIKYVERSRESTDLQNIAEIKAAVEAYVADSEGIDEDIEIKVTAETTTDGIEVSGPDDLDLTSYGIEMKSDCKSAKWTTYTWTYDCEDYSWTVTDGGHADYFNADGSAYVKPASGTGSN